ncbi:cation:proton antiporter regulatory subunit [Agromyces sp. Marseille-P2726]|uniref:cation:proton antiporter regulatory subunit n=1 Tax=Agromyces sp. Marseille-P2726 TaxID=2709132 RepID=UPI00156FD7F2|nr:TrkA C-terminal domain-containing protein [Agromyces sp. Marseille-P2726]
MIEVRRVDLPGVGVLHSFVTRDNREISVVVQRTGQSDLIVRPEDDDDEAKATTARLEPDEARTLAELLGGTRITESIADLDAMPGVPIGWVAVDPGDRIDGRELGSVEALNDSAVTVVAVVRGDEVQVTPPPSFRIQAGDMLVAAGAPDRIAEAFRAAGHPGPEAEEPGA